MSLFYDRGKLDETERRLSLEHSQKDLLEEVRSLRKRCKELEHALAQRAPLALPDETEETDLFHPIAEW